MPDPTIFSNSVFTSYILPFLLVFTFIFALIEKTKIIGEGRKQISAIIAFVAGLLVISVAYATNLINNLIVFMVVFAIALFIFILLYSFIGLKDSEFKPGTGMKVAGGIIVLIGVLGAVLYFSGAWSWLYERLVNRDGAGTVWVNVLFIAIIGGAMAIVLSGKK